jgi:RNA polymerase sigma-70 factor, ECF subfamily
MSNPDASQSVRDAIDSVYRTESRRILATLIRLVGDFDLAEEALHDAFVAAVEKWPGEGIPEHPRRWLVSAGRFKAIDRLRRGSRFEELAGADAESLRDHTEVNGAWHDDSDNDGSIRDDRLRLIFTCCHPALGPEAKVPLTLREVCGMTTEEIARCFLVSAPTIAKRIVRAKAKIREARIPYEVPPPADLPNRLDSVLQVIYLIFTEGYSASTGASLTRSDLSQEAIRLARLLAGLLPDAEVLGLLALMLLHESRRHSRTSPGGEVILLEDQDRTLWDKGLIEEGCKLVESAIKSRRFGQYTLQAAIAAVHAESSSALSTDWTQIIGLYDLLLRVQPSPVIELNRAVAVAMREGPAKGLVLVDALIERGSLPEYHLAYSTRADLCRRLGRTSEALAAYRKALQLAGPEPVKRFLETRLRELAASLEG